MGSRREMLAAAYLTVDGVLFLRRLLGIDGFPDVLALTDNVYFAEDQAVVDDQTVPVLVEAGLIDAEGTVDPALLRWLKVLANPDIEVALRAMEGPRMRRVALARCGDEHVLAARRNDDVVVQALWSSDGSFDDAVCAPLWAAMRVSAEQLAPDPAELEVLTMPLDEVSRLAGGTPGDMVRALQGQGVDARTAKVLNEVSTYSGQRVEIMMRQNMGLTKTDTPVGVMVADTSFGRVISGVRRRGSALSVTFGPGTLGRFRMVMRDLAQMTPARDWFAARPQTY